MQLGLITFFPYQPSWFVPAVPGTNDTNRKRGRSGTKPATAVSRVSLPPVQVNNNSFILFNNSFSIK
jgi:hypothetical protein